MTTNGKQHGVVKWFNEKKGYGFITPDDGGKDVFVHHTGILMDGFRTLREGERLNTTQSRVLKGFKLRTSPVTA